jgi:hypothetical protein|nr:MAG TPA: Portal protein [Caudoviricetes sp.]
MENKVYTKIWMMYQKCKDYLDKKRLVKKTERNWNFYIGNQWVGCNTGGEELPVINFISPIVRYKTAIVSQNSMTAKYSDIEERADLQPIYELLNQNFSKNWEKAKMDSKTWDIIKASCIQGDSYAYWGTDRTDMPPKILPNTAVLLGDENITELQEQPFIIIRERLEVEAVRSVAKANGIAKKEIELIVGDDNANSNNGVILNNDEVSNKVTSLLYMTKENGIVKVARSTSQCIYEPLHAIEGDVTGLHSYPICSMIWEPVPYNARGISEVAQMIPNQLEVNKTAARRAITVKLCAFPRIAYDSSTVQNPEDLDTVGKPIQVNGGGAQSVAQQVAYLNATNISSDAKNLQDDLLQTTKDLAGASDYAMGNVNPEQASGQAIIAVRDSAQIPLNENVARFKQFVEDVALLWFDMWVAYHPEGINVTSINDMGEEVQTLIDQQQLQELKPTVRIDVSQDNQWTKLSEQQWLDNMFDRQQLSLEEYAELAPDNGSVPKGKLRAVLSKREAMMKKQQEDSGAAFARQVLDLVSQGIPQEEAIALVQQNISQETAQEVVF